MTPPIRTVPFDFRELCGKENIARAVGVTKSAIETQLVSVCGCVFEHGPNGPLRPADIRHDPARREVMLRYVIASRFSDCSAGSSKQLVSEKISAIDAMSAEVVSGVFAVAREALQAASSRGQSKLTAAEANKVDAAPSLRKIAACVGVSASAMTSRFRKLREKNPGVGDEVLIRSMWEKVGAGSVDPGLAKRRKARDAYFAAVVALSAFGGFASEMARVAMLLDAYMSSTVSLLRYEIADELLKVESEAPLPDHVLREFITDAANVVFARYGISSVGDANRERIVDAYWQMLEGGPSAEVDFAVSVVVDQHSVWQQFVKAVPDSVIFDGLVKNGELNLGSIRRAGDDDAGRGSPLYTRAVARGACR